MARKLPDHSRHIGSINYRCATMARQLEGLRLALVGFATSGDRTEADLTLGALRDQLALLEADMPAIARDQAAWRAECDSGQGR
jgi:hypothetical protein